MKRQRATLGDFVEALREALGLDDLPEWEDPVDPLIKAREVRAERAEIRRIDRAWEKAKLERGRARAIAGMEALRQHEERLLNAEANRQGNRDWKAELKRLDALERERAKNRPALTRCKACPSGKAKIVIDGGELCVFHRLRAERHPGAHGEAGGEGEAGGRG